MDQTIAVVILNWNGRHFLEKYLLGVEKHSQFPNVSIVVADNASTDDSLSYLRTNHSRARIIALDRNYGFAEGYNRALQHVEADYYVLLNSDIEVTESWLPPLLELMQRKPEVAACMPKIKSASDHLYFEYAGAAGGFIDKLGYPFCRGRIFDTVEKDRGQYDIESEIFWATGACLMIRVQLFRQVGGFDSLFFAHMEEIDLCWRLKNAGYSIWYTPQSVVYHVGGGTLPQVSPFKTFLNYRNNLLMMYKNLLPQKHRRHILSVRIMLDGISAMYSVILKGDFSMFKTVWKAYKSYRKLRHKYRLASENTDHRDHPFRYSSCMYRHSIVYQYFIKRNKTFSDLIHTDFEL